MNQWLLDVGSHSLKLYRSSGSGLQLESTVCWRVLENQGSTARVETYLAKVLEASSTQDDRIEAFGTEAMRRNEVLSEKVRGLLSSKGVSYRTISQREEASLIRTAVMADPELEVVNVGGGSIQLIRRSNLTRQSESQIVFYDFGISDLNQRFALNEVPVRRKIRECVDWLIARLPDDLGSFIYTGGERTYLERLGVSVRDGFCTAADFQELHVSLSHLSAEELESRSPFGNQWMSGAIASNCVVIALLERSGKSGFFPSDKNIADGMRLGVLGALGGE